MNYDLQSAYSGAVASTQQRNKVLRNTYWLLALSMLPTVLGAWVGVPPASPPPWPAAWA